MLASANSVALATRCCTCVRTPAALQQPATFVHFLLAVTPLSSMPPSGSAPLGADGRQSQVAVRFNRSVSLQSSPNSLPTLPLT
jgi:hypothetical protein